MIEPLAYHRPSDLATATRLARQEEAVFLAGGQSLLRDLKRGLRRHVALIDIGRLVGRSIREDVGAIVIEAGATHAAVAGSPMIQNRIPMLAAMAGHIADPLVRHRATIGGALAGNEPAGDYPAVALALDATIITTDQSQPATSFLAGAGGTALMPGEVIVSVSFPIPVGASYAKILNPAARYAMVGACAALGSDDHPRLAITGASTGGAFRWVQAETALARRFGPASLIGLEPPSVAMREDLFTDGVYRAHLVSVIAKRAIEAASTGVAVNIYSYGRAL